MSEIAPYGVTPFQTLLKSSPQEMARFCVGTSTIRHTLEGPELRDGVILAPLRGAMPILWSAEGLEDVETALPSDVAELPLGVFHYMRRDGLPKSTSPSHEQKRASISSALRNIFEVCGIEIPITLVDEVQKGGTITQAAKLIRHVMDLKDANQKLSVIAAQDSRERVRRELKVPKYLTLASNSFDGISTTVVPLPLIPTDRAPMLDTVTLEGDFTTARDFNDRISVNRNVVAMHMFRTLGTLARLEDLRHDAGFIGSFVDSQGALNEHEAARAEDWLIEFNNFF